MSASRPPVLLVVAAMVFVAFLALLLAQSLAPKRVETFTLGAHTPRPLAAGRTDTVTLDVRDSERWHYLDLDRGLLLAPPDSHGWDLAARRFQLRVPVTPALTAPSVADATGNLTRWYRYDFLAHLLRPAGHPYQLRTDGGHTVTLEVLGYYCPGPTAGCLTVRYTADPAEGRSSEGQ
ncbi:MAG TPA: hypothetical protein VGA02_11460 [Gemmatimonadales bacterium]|jgi:hypothetical protein